jgi:hypothetical protein
MSFKHVARAELAAVIALTLGSSSIAGAASVRRITVFAEGAAVNASAPDSIAAFMSYTNPTGPSDATIQLLVRGSNPLRFTTILTMGAIGTDLATGLPDQPTTQNDPDSLKLTPSGDLLLSSGDDGQLVFVRHPGTDEQSVSFLTLLDPLSGQHVTGLDDAVFATAQRGVFYLADTGNNRVLAIQAEDLAPGSLFASVGSVNALVSVGLETGKVSPFVGNLNGPHGLVFLPHREDEGEDLR